MAWRSSSRWPSASINCGTTRSGATTFIDAGTSMNGIGGCVAVTTTHGVYRLSVGCAPAAVAAPARALH
jgi:hypothetical protein